jgi:hypothetical protein
MIELDSGNVLLKPSQRKQLLTWLRRAVRLGRTLGDCVVRITMRRVGRTYELIARVHDSAGDFACRCRQHDWRRAMRALAGQVADGLHRQRVALASARV